MHRSSGSAHAFCKAPSSQLGILLGLFAICQCIGIPLACAETSWPTGLQDSSGATASSSDYKTYYQIKDKAAKPADPANASSDTGKWDVTLGLGVVAAPKYLGSKGYTVAPMPIASVIYDKTYFLNSSGAGANLVNWKGLTVGPLLGFNFGRRHTDSTSRLNGMENIQPNLDAGGFVTYNIHPFTVGANLLQSVSNTNYGFSGNIHASFKEAIVPKTLDFEVGPELDFGSDDYMRTWFGVSNYESSRSGLRPYTADGGVRDVGINASLGYHYDEHITLNTFMDIKRLTGDASDSPIVETSTQVLVGTGIAYHF